MNRKRLTLFLLLFLLFLLLLLLLILSPLGALPRAREHVELVAHVALELLNALALSAAAAVAGVAGAEAQQLAVLVDEAVEELVQAVIRAQEVELEVARLALRQRRQEGAPVAREEERCQAHDVEVERADVGHARREAELRRLCQAARLLGRRRRRGGFTGAAGGDGRAAAGADLAEAPGVEGAVCILGA